MPVNRSDFLASRFMTTRWSVVVAAGDTSAPQSRAALSTLCLTYWYPLYVYVRRRGYGPVEAQDLTQDFFARLLAKNYLKNARPEGGRFRSYLLGAMKHFLANEWDRQRAGKRGGGQAPLSLDFDTAEGRYSFEPADETTAESLFDKRWALQLLDKVLDDLRAEFATAGKAEQFERLKTLLTADSDKVPYRDLAAKLGMTEGALKVAVHRLRKRYRELLRQEIAQTVADPTEVDDELRHLFAALGG